MEPVRALFWERDSLGSKENLAELYVGCNPHAHEEGSAFTVQVNICSSRKME